MSAIGPQRSFPSMLLSNKDICSTCVVKRACLVSKREIQAKMTNGLSGGTASVEAEISRIQMLEPDEVRALWCGTFKKGVPKGLTRDLLVRTLCWHMQERAYGGHDRATLQIFVSYAKGKPDAQKARRLKPGTEIVREYQGERHTVVVTAEGFRWRDADYSSLTAIAQAITGTNWNGPRFFGLRMARDRAGSAAARDKASSKDRPSGGSKSDREARP
jgi:hypothetical protein